MNPLVRKAAHEELDGFDRLHIIDPLEVLDFHNFMAVKATSSSPTRAASRGRP